MYAFIAWKGLGPRILPKKIIDFYCAFQLTRRHTYTRVGCRNAFCVLCRDEILLLCCVAIQNGKTINDGILRMHACIMAKTHTTLTHRATYENGRSAYFLTWSCASAGSPKKKTQQPEK